MFGIFMCHLGMRGAGELARWGRARAGASRAARRQRRHVGRAAGAADLALSCLAARGRDDNALYFWPTSLARRSWPSQTHPQKLPQINRRDHRGDAVEYYANVCHAAAGRRGERARDAGDRGRRNPVDDWALAESLRSAGHLRLGGWRERDLRAPPPAPSRVKPPAECGAGRIASGGRRARGAGGAHAAERNARCTALHFT